MFESIAKKDMINSKAGVVAMRKREIGMIEVRTHPQRTALSLLTSKGRDWDD